MSDIGGGTLKQFSFSKAFGINPSAASGTVLLAAGSSFSLGVGDYVVYSFGSVASFPGVVTEVAEAANFGQGREQTFQVVDNRIRLGWQAVFGAWNIEDDLNGMHSGRPASPSTGSDSSSHGTDGADFLPLSNPPTPVGAGNPEVSATPWQQRRRYRHLLPEHFESGLWTWTEAPLSTREILNSAFNHAWGDFGFTRNYHSALDDTLLTGLDYTSGVKLSNLVSEINSRAGLDLTISGSRSLIWLRKGDGLPPVPDASCSSYSSGSSLAAVDTAVRVVGGRVRMQRINVTLEPDWKPAWNAFIDELAWLREVADAFSKPTATKSDLLDLAAYARSVTVYQYAKQKADTAFLDTRPFGRVSRAQLPAWVYIRELVYRSYRIPPAFTLHGVPLSSLDLADSLLCNTDITGDGSTAKQCYAEAPIQFYPGVQATAIARGQPLDLINARDIRLFYRNSTKDLRNEWTTAPQFEVDAIGKSIRFAVPTFIDGDAAEGKSIYLRVNKGEGGGDDLSALLGSLESDYLDIVVPNPDFEIAPAEVRASFCFLLGNYFKDYGKGPRRGPLPANGLDLHVLDMASDTGFSSAALDTLASSEIRMPSVSGSFKEVLYDDGGKAADKAEKIGESALTLSAIQASGGFTRNGLAGTPLTACVDRVTVDIDFASGITEKVDYTKARSTSVALAERSLQRIQRSEELFNGQDALKREIREYKLLAKAERQPRSRARSHTSFTDVFEKPVGSETPSTVMVRDKNAAAPTRDGVKKWLAGDLVWLDAKGYPVASGGTFGGVVVSASKNVGTEESQFQSKELHLAYAGRVPVRVEPGIQVNGTVFADSGGHLGKTAGAVIIGRLAHGEATPAAPSGELLAMVDLGGGASSAEAGPCYLGEIITWSADGSDSGSDAEIKTGIRGGLVECGDRIWSVPHIEVALTPDRVQWVSIRTFIRPNTDDAESVSLQGISISEVPEIRFHESQSEPDYGLIKVPPIFSPIMTEGVWIYGIGLPLGKLTVAAGVVTFERTGCGHFVLTHCPGVLSYYRTSDLGASSSASI